MKRIGGVWIAKGDRDVIGMDTANHSMLADLHRLEGQPSASMLLLQLIHASSRAQQHHVHWSRHLLAYIRKVTAAQLLIGSSTMTYNLHFHFFVSPNTTDRLLGASVTWRQVPALLLLDLFLPLLDQQSWARPQRTHQGCGTTESHAEKSRCRPT
jgi:hypothetical protein